MPTWRWFRKLDPRLRGGDGVIVAGAIALASSLGSTPVAAQDTDAEARAVWAQTCEEWDEWDKPAPPFRIFADTWYVGTCGIAVIFVADETSPMAGRSPQHILFDSGTEAGGEIVLANIRSLGFDPADISQIFVSHEHYDHVGGIALIQELSGADVFASEMAKQALETGYAIEGDPQFGILPEMTPVANVRAFPSDHVVLGPSAGGAVQSLATPGHTPGALTWQWESCEGEDCRTIVYADSLSPVSSDAYRFSDHPDYVQAYREGLARLAELECDILLTPHPSASGMRDKLIAGDLSGGLNCREYAELIDTRLSRRLAEEARSQ